MMKKLITAALVACSIFAVPALAQEPKKPTILEGNHAAVAQLIPDGFQKVDKVYFQRTTNKAYLMTDGEKKEIAFFDYNWEKHFKDFLEAEGVFPFYARVVKNGFLTQLEVFSEKDLANSVITFDYFYLKSKKP